MIKNITRKFLTLSTILILTQSASIISPLASTINRENTTQNVFSRNNKKHDEHKEYNKSRNLSIAAEVLNMPEEELKKQIDSGKNLYNLINEAGKTQEFKDKILVELKSHLNEEIKRGRLTKEKAEEIYEKKKIKIDSWDGKTQFTLDESEFFNQKKFTKIAVDILNINEQELKKELDSGKTLVEVLKDAGKLDVFKAKITEELKKQLDKEVNEGRFTKDEATKMLNEFKDKMNKWNGEEEKSS